MTWDSHVESIYVTPQDASPQEWAQRQAMRPPPDHSWLTMECTGCRQSFPYDAEHKCRRWWHRLLR